MLLKLIKHYAAEVSIEKDENVCVNNLFLDHGLN